MPGDLRAASGALLSLALLAVGSCAPRGTESALERAYGGTGPLRYQLAVDPGLTTASVRVCFDGAPPQRLEAISDGAGDFLLGARGATGLPIPIRGGELDLSRAAPGSCVRYGVDLGAASATRFAMRRDDDLVHSHTAWLLRPSPMPEAPIRLEFELPAGLRASTPWPPVGVSGAVLLPPSAFRRPATVAFGRFEVDVLEIGAARLEVAVVAGRLDVGREGVARWLERAGGAVAQLHGAFPRERVQVVVVPVGPGGGGVAFGLVRRGGGPSVMLLVHENATEQELEESWVAVHELSHLAMPLFQRRDTWLSEGFASYYQEVLRARAGLQTPLEAWRRLDGGFDRGRFGTAGRQTLRDASADMRNSGAYHRVYWSGAAFMLEADMRLRAAGASLDEAVAANTEAFIERTGAWRGEGLTERLDRVPGRSLTRRLYESYARLRRFPDVERLYAQLGLVRGDDGRLELDPYADAAKVALRDAIMAPRTIGGESVSGESLSGESPRLPGAVTSGDASPR